MRRSTLVGMTLLMLASVSCGDDSPGVGTEGGPCRADGTCEGNLVCLSNLCVGPTTCTSGTTLPCQCQTGIDGEATCDGSGVWGPCICAGACGDGAVDPGEECDDGNNENGDGCSADCVIEPCGNGVCEMTENPTTCPLDCPPTEKVDALFVIDNSGSMAAKQAAIASQITSFISSLRSDTRGLPDVHIGVTSTDLGTGVFSITHCDDPPGGDAGRLLTNTCATPTGAPYIVNVAPTGCTIERDTSGQCTTHDCTQSNCEEGTLETDAHGCPRCTNHQGEPLEDVFSCISQLGTLGCGFEQPLEAMRKALDPSNTHNAGFLRPDSVLAVFFLTDEDDCSASTPQLFDPTQTAIDSPLGPLTSFRCFEFGVTCDINLRTATGVRENCQPREDSGALLYPISEYVSFLAGLRDPGRIVVAAAAGPVQNQSVTVTLDNDTGWPELGYSCTTPNDGAVPAIRLLAMVEQFVDPLDLGWAFSPICSLDYSGALSSFAMKIRSRL